MVGRLTCEDVQATFHDVPLGCHELQLLRLQSNVNQRDFFSPLRAALEGVTRLGYVQTTVSCSVQNGVSVPLMCSVGAGPFSCSADCHTQGIP